MAQRDDKHAAERRERMQMVVGGILGVALIVGVVLAIVLTAGGDEGEDVANGTGTTSVQAPTANVSDLDAAVKQAGCELKTGLESEGREHADREFTPADYKTNPPTSGIHFPEWYQDGIYEPGGTDDLGRLVHTLEHGRINLQYKPGTSDEVVGQLEELYNEFGGYHMLLYENKTEMPYQIAATAWTQSLGCERVSPAAFDAIRAFTKRYVDKGPEQVP